MPPPLCLLVINIRLQNAFEHLHVLKTSLLTNNPWYCQKPTLSPPVSGDLDSREKGLSPMEIEMNEWISLNAQYV
jgi:hypothetical protein